MVSVRHPGSFGDPANLSKRELTTYHNPVLTGCARPHVPTRCPQLQDGSSLQAPATKLTNEIQVVAAFCKASLKPTHYVFKPALASFFFNSSRRYFWYAATPFMYSAFAR